MRLRPYDPADASALAAMLVAEGWPEGHHFQGCPTVVWDEGTGPQGFFTVEIRAGWLYLHHFCIAGAARHIRHARALIRSVRQTAAAVGASYLLVYVASPRLRRLVEWYFHVRPYIVADSMTAYRVEIGGQ